MPSFRADPAAIRSHGDDVAAGGDALAAEIAGFETAAYEVNDAFGFLGPSAEAMADYLDMASETVAGLRSLAHRLQADGVLLWTSSENYRGADDNSTVGG